MSAAPRGAGATAHAATNGKSQMEATLQRIWAQCLGVGSIDRNANFFELGGDSLIAISVAMTAANEGLDLTPQDLYENQTRGRARQGSDRPDTRRAVWRASRRTTSCIPRFRRTSRTSSSMGCGSAGRWRIPLILRLRPDVAVEDVRAVLTALTNHHDALRLQIVQRAGTWEQHVGEPQEFTDLATRSLPDGIVPGSAQEREAVLDILNEQIAGSGPVEPAADRHVCPWRCRADRAISRSACTAMVGDNASRDILLTDIFTAFGQRLAGEEIVLQPVTTSWREWSRRCAALATHPAVVESRDLLAGDGGESDPARGQGRSSEPPGVDDLVRLSSTLTVVETTEIDDARRRLRLPIEEILLAALGRTIAATVGDGSVAVDLGGPGRSVLKPDVDLRRTVGWFTTVYPGRSRLR